MKLLGNVELLDYQRRALTWMRDRESDRNAPGGILALDMGLGKTLLSIAVVCARGGKTLVVVPTNLVSQWAAEFVKFTGEEPLIVNATDSNKGRVSPESLAAHEVVLAPISLFSSMKNEAILGATFDRVIVDEAHLIRNKNTKTFKKIASIESKIKWCLTGTPIVKDERNLATLLEFMSIFRVNLKYAAREFVFRLVKEDVITMPKLVVEEIRSTFMDPKEREAYEDLLVDGRAALAAYKAYADGEGRMEILKIILRLRQCVANVNIVPMYDDPDKFYEGTSTKLKMLEDDIMSSPMQKTIIFFTFHKEADRIAEMLASHGLASARLDGKVKFGDRTKAIERFEKDPSCNFFLVQIDAGGIGLNLQMATRIYMNGIHWNGSSDVQAIARAYRIGQQMPVTVKRLIIDRSIDDAIIGIQQRKFECASDILNDPRIKTTLTKKSSGMFMRLAEALFGM